MKNTPEHAVSMSPLTPARREQYVPPSIQPLGAWQSLTLVTTVPVHFGGYIFSPKGEEIV